MRLGDRQKSVVTALDLNKCIKQIKLHRTPIELPFNVTSAQEVFTQTIIKLLYKRTRLLGPTVCWCREVDRVDRMAARVAMETERLKKLKVMFQLKFDLTLYVSKFIHWFNFFRGSVL